MVAEYTSRFYKPAAQTWRMFTESKMEKAKSLAAWKKKLIQEWNNIKIEDVDVQIKNGKADAPLVGNTVSLEVGSEMQITANVRLGGLSPADVSVQVYHGSVDSWGNINQGSVKSMENTEPEKKEGPYQFTGTIKCTRSGKCGFAIRVMPKHEELAESFEPGLIMWEPINGDGK
jgi:starch phosphorylase